MGASYKGKDRVTAFGIWGGIAAVGAAVGPIIGGIFTTYLTWRLVFGSEVVIVADHIFIKTLPNRINTNIKLEGFRHCRSFTFNSITGF